MDTNNVTDDASSSHRDNLEAIFISEKLDKSDELVYAINNLTINNAVY